MRSNRYTGLMLASATAMLTLSLPLAESSIGQEYKPKVRGTKPNPERMSKAEKKRERKNQQRLKLAKIG